MMRLKLENNLKLSKKKNQERILISLKQIKASHVLQTFKDFNEPTSLWSFLKFLLSKIIYIPYIYTHI